VQSFPKGVDRAGSDIAIDHANGPDCQGRKGLAAGQVDDLIAFVAKVVGNIQFALIKEVQLHIFPARRERLITV
jgi:hypothetical protein